MQIPQQETCFNADNNNMGNDFNSAFTMPQTNNLMDTSINSFNDNYKPLQPTVKVDDMDINKKMQLLQSERNIGINIPQAKSFDPTKSPNQMNNGNSNDNFFFQNNR